MISAPSAGLSSCRQLWYPARTGVPRRSWSPNNALPGGRSGVPGVPFSATRGPCHNGLVGASDAGCSGFVGHIGALEHRGAHPWPHAEAGSGAQQPRPPGRTGWEDPDGKVGRYAHGRAREPCRSRLQLSSSDALPVPPRVSYRPCVSAFVSAPLTSLRLPAPSRADGEDTDRAVDQELRPTEGHLRPLAQTARRG